MQLLLLLLSVVDVSSEKRQHLTFVERQIRYWIGQKLTYAEVKLSRP